jgi:hypothetical protein
MERTLSREQSRKIISNGRNIDIVALEKRMTELELFILSIESKLEELINEINLFKKNLANLIH